MDESRLLRLLYYPGKDSMREYTHGNKFISELYKVFLVIKGRRTDLNFSAVEFFNEVYYLCTRIYNDPNPEDNTRAKYFTDTMDEFSNPIAVHLIYSMVYAIFYTAKDKPENIEFFLVHLKAILDNSKESYYVDFQRFADGYIKDNGYITCEFPVTPCPPQLLSDGKTNWSAWRNVTLDFDKSEIHSIIHLYSSKKDKLEILNIIEDAHDEGLEQEKTINAFYRHVPSDKSFYLQLRDEISSSSSIDSKNITSTIDQLAKMINDYNGDNFDAFLKEYDWHSVPSEEIVPCKNIRNLIRGITNNEKKLQTARFLQKYEDYYFQDIYDETGILTVFSIADFHKELSFLIEQLASDGEFNCGKYERLNAEYLELKKQHNEDLNTIKTLRNDLSTLTSKGKDLPAKHPGNLISVSQVYGFASDLDDQTHRMLFYSMLQGCVTGPTPQEKKLIDSLRKSKKLQPVIKADTYIENQHNEHNIEHVEPGASGITITEPKQLKK